MALHVAKGGSPIIGDPPVHYSGTRWPMSRTLRNLIWIVAAFGLVASACSSTTTPEVVEPAGAVSFADLEAAALATADCMRGAGLEVTRPPDYNPDAFVFGFEWRDGSLGEEEQDSIFWKCSEEHYEPISALWLDANQAEIGAQNRALDEGIILCLRDRGIEVTELTPATRDELDSTNPGARRECLLEYLDSRQSSGG